LSDRTLSCSKCERQKEMSLNNKVSVRLTADAQAKLEQALKQGHSKSEFIHAAVLSAETGVPEEPPA